jgi:hypothetical protein
MTEYDYSPEAHERYMATQTRISNWANNVSQSIPTQPPAVSPSQFSSHPSSDYYQSRSRPNYPNRYSHSQTRSNSVTRSHSRDQYHVQREPSRQRSHSYSNSRPQASRAYTFSQPLYSRTYAYALNQPPPPAPIPVPQPMPHSQLAPRRSRTLPPQSHNVVYTYDAPHGPTYVMMPPGGVPPHARMHPAVTPTKRAQPLLKRLFTSFGPWGSSSSGPPSSKSKHSHQTLRRHRRSSF